MDSLVLLGPAHTHKQCDDFIERAIAEHFVEFTVGEPIHQQEVAVVVTSVPTFWNEVVFVPPLFFAPHVTSVTFGLASVPHTGMASLRLSSII